jgi:hypothetical protein
MSEPRASESPAPAKERTLAPGLIVRGTTTE